MFVIDEELFERIRTEYVAGGMEPLLEKYGEELKKILQKALGSHDYAEFEKRLEED
jgi:inhibitor of KinA sporulation pathway (predicted exonuclease)